MSPLVPDPVLSEPMNVVFAPAMFDPLAFCTDSFWATGGLAATSPSCQFAAAAEVRILVSVALEVCSCNCGGDPGVTKSHDVPGDAIVAKLKFAPSILGNPWLDCRKPCAEDITVWPLPLSVRVASVPSKLLLRRDVPETCSSMRLPVNPLAAFTPRPVPFVDHPVEVVPLGSININGFVVVALPPVTHVPVRLSAGPAPLDNAPFPVISVP